MKVFKLYSNKFIIFLNVIHFVKVFSIQLNRYDFQEGEGSGMDESTISIYQPNVFKMEEKVNSLLDTINQLELRMKNLKNETLISLENNFLKIIDDRDREIETKINQMDKNKNPYNVHDIKCSDNRQPTSCYDLKECTNNVYNIKVPDFSDDSFPVVCDLTSDNGGWTVIQRRQDGSENFFRNWMEYVEGFGNMNGEFFIGLEKLYALTSLGEPQELYIILEDFEGERRYARYGEFKVDSSETDYMLTVGRYSGDADDCFSQHNGCKFSTKDRDNDDAPMKNCAAAKKGAWWYSSCYFSNLNGLYLAGKISKNKSGVSWCTFRGHNYSLKFVQMMIRPKTD